MSTHSAASEFCCLYFTDGGPNKVLVMKKIRELLGVSLEEAKRLFENPGWVVSEDIFYVQLSIQHEFAALGAETTIGRPPGV